MIRVLFAAALATLVAGCGLIDPNVADFDLSLPQRMVKIDTADWQLSGASQVPAVPCGGMPANYCSSATQNFCGGDACTGSCDGQNCQVSVLIDLWNTFDLAMSKPELQMIDNQPLVSVSIDKVSYDVSENTFNVDAPPLTVYVAPQTVMSPDNKMAEKVGTIPAIKAGETVTDAQVQLTPTGTASLTKFMKDYKTPFNVIVGGRFTLHAGDPVPQGRLVGVVKVSAHAGI